LHSGESLVSYLPTLPTLPKILHNLQIHNTLRTLYSLPCRLPTWHHFCHIWHMDKTEGRIQQEVIMWFRNKWAYKQSPKPLIFSIPNDLGIKFIPTGLLSGAADLQILLPNGISIFAETKTPKGRQSDKQVKFERDVIALGFNYFVYRSLDEFKTKFISLLNEINRQHRHSD
jgi:hypothetical protein